MMNLQVNTKGPLQGGSLKEIEDGEKSAVNAALANNRMPSINKCGE